MENLVFVGVSNNSGRTAIEMAGKCAQSFSLDLHRLCIIADFPFSRFSISYSLPPFWPKNCHPALCSYRNQPFRLTSRKSITLG